MKTQQLISNIIILWMFTEISEAQLYIQDPAQLLTQVGQTGEQNEIPDTHDKKRHALKRWVDRYRFFGAGLGKRAFNDHGTANIDDININTDTFPEGTITKSLYPKILQNKFKALIKDVLTEILRDIDVDQFENKRVPEVFKEEYYPIQGGKQQLEFKLDKTLDNDTADKPLDTYQGALNIQAADLAGLFSNENKPSTSSGQEDEAPVIKKRWWAINQLRAFRHPKSASSTQWHRRGRVRIDPGLYFVGLGR